MFNIFRQIAEVAVGGLKLFDGKKVFFECAMTGSELIDDRSSASFKRVDAFEYFEWICGEPSIVAGD
jgi:hypothetical protein